MAEFSDPRDILILSSALQLFHITSPQFAEGALKEHSDLFTEEIIGQMDRRIVDLINSVNGEARMLFPDITKPSEMHLRWQPYAVWGSHTLNGAHRFAAMVEELEDQIENQIKQYRARNN